MIEYSVDDVIAGIERKDELFRTFGYDRLIERGKIRGVQLHGRILDAGVGDCHTLRELAKVKGASVVSIDINVDAVERGRTIMEYYYGPPDLQEFPDVTFQTADLTQLPFPDRSFDCSIAANVLHHIQDWPAAVSELLRVTSDIIIIQEFSKRGKKIIDRLMMEQDGELNHSHRKDGVTIWKIKKLVWGVRSDHIQSGFLTDMLIVKM